MKDIEYTESPPNTACSGRRGTARQDRRSSAGEISALVVSPSPPRRRKRNPFGDTTI